MAGVAISFAAMTKEISTSGNHGCPGKLLIGWPLAGRALAAFSMLRFALRR